MSQFFTGIPIGRKRVLFIDSMMTLLFGMFLVFLGISHVEETHVVVELNYPQVLFGIALILFATLNPIHMSAMFPTSVFMLWDDEEEEKQQK